MALPSVWVKLVKTVLLAEDDDLTRSLIKVVLSRQGVCLLAADNGEEAFQLFQQWRPECLITDLFMPKLGGIALIRKVREVAPEVKVIAFSGAFIQHSDRHRQLQAEVLAAGGNALLSKPIDHSLLLEALELTL